MLLEVLSNAPRLCVTLIALGEYEYDLCRSSRQAELRGWLHALLRRVDVLSPTRATLPHYAAIRHELKTAGTPIPANDVWIAALLRQYDVPIVSRDRHFDSVQGVKRVAW